ncbi:MAG: N-acylglucosamine 2-epimerase [Lachnospiraceae bacterium]|nr:N-acylglucosamine 2-epimerase [Lachnospiraceae bacterium]
MFTSEIKEHLTKVIIPFWRGLKDEKYGGFYGYMGYDLGLDEKAVKGCILNSRILWFFSNAYLVLKEEDLLTDAEHAFRFLRDYCVDKENGGVYWSLAFDGKPEDTTKHTYNQAFAIYALSSYYDASRDEEALSLAWELYEIIESKCRDEYGYLEAFNVRFEPEENDKLSENGVMAEKTMNTLLHVFEAYTELYRVTREGKVADKIRYMMDLIADKVYNKEAGRQEVFFDRTWNSLIDLYSYGHDIETAWLVDRGLEVLDDRAYTEKLSPITRTITENIYKRAYIDHSLVNEAENGVVDTTRVWWVQAEAVVGFLNGYQKAPQHREYLEAARDIWDYIKTCVVDKRSGSEWFWSVDRDRKPVEKPIVEPWKCPYHNGRMCFEVIKRNVEG